MKANPNLRRSLRRLMTEYNQIKKDKECSWFRAEPCKDSANNENADTYKWDIEIDGFEGSLYHGYVLRAEMIFPGDYPISPPKLKFVTPMFHPNIYKDGLVCISILHTNSEPFLSEPATDQWTPIHSIRTILLSVVLLLNEPYLDSPANVDASKCYRASKEEYEAQVKLLLEVNCRKNAPAG